MKTMLLLVLLNTQTGKRITIETPMEDFSACLKAKEEVLAQNPQIPATMKVKTFECIVGAE